MSVSWSYLLWTVTIQLFTTLSRLGHTALRALSHYGPLCQAKWQSYSFLLYLKLYFSGMRIQKLQSTSLPVQSENSTYHINKQEMSQPLAILASKCAWGLPKLWFSKCCQPLQGDCWGAGGMQEARWTRNQDWPLIAEVHVKGMNFSEPRGLLLPTHRMVNSLVDSWSLVFRTPASFVADLYIAWLPLLPPWSSFLRATEILSPGLRVLNIPTK